MRPPNGWTEATNAERQRFHLARLKAIHHDRYLTIAIIWIILMGFLIVSWGCTPIRTAAPYSAVFQGQMRPQPAYAYYPPPMYYSPMYQPSYRPVPMTCVNLGGVVLKCH